MSTRRAAQRTDECDDGLFSGFVYSRKSQLLQKYLVHTFDWVPQAITDSGDILTLAVSGVRELE